MVSTSCRSPGRPYGRLEWPAMLRKVEAETRNNGYPYYAS